MTNEELREKNKRFADRLAVWLHPPSKPHTSCTGLKDQIAQFINEDQPIRDAYNAGLEDAIEKMRHDCVACEGSGIMPGCGPDEAECEYCGRPMSTVRALKLREGDDANDR